MDESSQIATGLKTVFSHRSSFIVIGLTGRTGSGCSTIAGQLCNGAIDSIKLPQIQSPPRTNNDRRNKIVFEWIKEDWPRFTKIKVSNIILLLSLVEGKKRFIDYLKSIENKIDHKKLNKIIDDEIEYCDVTHKTLNDIKNADNDLIINAYNFIFDRLEKISDSLKECLNSGNGKYFTKIFQLLGDNVRRSGSPLETSINPENLFTLPDLIAKIIKLSRYRNKISKNNLNYFIIDALRHPLEIRYLRERIVPFYAVSITTADDDRRDRLFKKDYKQTEIEDLDDKEYPMWVKGKKKKKAKDNYASFVSQNIQACLEISDIYICNYGKKEKHDSKLDTSDAVFNLLKYISLMQHPGLILPTNSERCMQVAFTAKMNSGCISRQVGAIVCDENYSIKAVGWNDVPKGKVSCLYRNISNLIKSNNQDEMAYSKYEKGGEFTSKVKKIYKGKDISPAIKGRNLSFCFKDIYNEICEEKNQVHTRSLHAEENAFMQIVKYGGEGLQGGFLFTSASPCELCSKKAFQLGIKKIYYIDPYPGISIEHVLSEGECGPSIELFTGAIGRAYHMLYEPIMPYKDELNKIFISSNIQKTLF